ncbi:MAG TPA: hypothetical protein ENN06_08720 [Desulfobacteraceae bacterium]|nr:hypothetical protein [Desulfobacteraceae bacterium]
MKHCNSLLQFFESGLIKLNNTFQVNVMKEKMQRAIFSSLAFAMVLTGFAGTAESNVCERGLGEPAFLSEGVEANVLLLIDNSASMYDMAYDDIEEPGYCNDDSYIPQGTIHKEEWDLVTAYKENTFVHILEWNSDDQSWEKKWYRATANIPAGAEMPGSNSAWVAADWTTGTDYNQGDIVMILERFPQEDGTVFYAYQWYMAIRDATAAADEAAAAGDPLCSGSNPQTNIDCWRRIPSRYGGYFDNDAWYEWNDSAQVFQKMDPQPADSSAACSANTADSPPEERYKNDDLCEVIQPQGFSHTLISFTAKGNYLNWLASSKFDVEKKVLTGGKYENQKLVMESRGCLGRRMIRQVMVETDSGEPMILTMGVSKGEETTGIGASLEGCLADCVPANLDSCITDCNDQCILFCQPTDCINGCISELATCESACEESSPSAVQVQRCKDGCADQYNVCTALCTPDDECVDSCQENCEITCVTECENECTESWNFSGLDADITRIEFFAPTTDGFQFGNAACEEALAASAFGQLQNLAGECLEIGKQNESFANSNAAFNHGFQTCWGYPVVGNGDIIRMINACSNVYLTGLDPDDIDMSDSGHVCASLYVGRCMEGLDTDSCVFDACPGTLTEGQRCIDGTFYDCPANYVWDDSLNTCIYVDNQGNQDPSMQSPVVIQHTGNCDVNWVDGYNINIDDDNLPDPRTSEGCVEWALRDYCGALYNPPVPDAERPVESVAEDHFPNLPAILVDVAINAQLGDPFKTVPGLINIDEPPTGLLHNVSGGLKIGAMTFNTMGTAWEVENSTDPNITSRDYFYGCDPADAGCTNRDGAIITAYITDGNSNDALVESINSIKATTWTPMAEAMYNAIGYYTRDTRLNTPDFYKGGDSVDSWQNGIYYTLGSLVKDGDEVFWAISQGISEGSNPSDDTGVTWASLVNENLVTEVESELDPVKAWCQSNNILILTDGAPTADWNQIVRDFAVANGDPDTDVTNQCDRFYGSTYLDDMTFYGNTQMDQEAGIDSIYAQEQFVTLYGDYAVKQPIETYVVTTGSLLINGPENECRADILLERAAINGGTDQYYPGEDPDQLEEQLEYLFGKLSTRASAGSAASVISSARGGEGAIYQAIFWPEIVRQNDEHVDSSVTWVGDVHGLFLDSRGFMFEDSDGNRMLEPLEDDGNGGTTGVDKRVIIFFNGTRSQACRGASNVKIGDCTEIVELEDVNYLWSANEWLSGISSLDSDGIPQDDDILTNRTSYLSADELKRYIFTWNDLNNDGIVDDDEIIDLETSALNGLTVSDGRNPVINDFGLEDSTELDILVSWIRGKDSPDGTLRSRRIPEANGSATDMIWRLGDIIHSTPMTVAAPAEGYHLIYNDFSYAQFLNRWKNRRHMVYFGANDGLLHAVNAGFYRETDNKFYLGFDYANRAYNDNGPALGTEMWAYLPYNLTPHLKCLTARDYRHKYFVDQRPRIFDVQIFEEEPECRDDGNLDLTNEDCIHPNGWGTILVGGMRFGGATVRASELTTDNNIEDKREFISSYFILDITNPEEPPVLLGELTREADSETVDLGYSTVIPTMIIMKDSNIDVNKWYLLFGSGPHENFENVDANNAIKGLSDSPAKVSVLPLDWLVEKTLSPKSPLRIPAAKPDQSTSPEAGTFVLYDGGVSPELRSDNGFVSDMITVDFDINPNYREYKADAAYFGTVQGDFALGWGGLMYRLVTKIIGDDGSPLGVGIQDSGDEPVRPPYEWKIKPLIDLRGENQPITAAASVGTDNYKNFWIYFGTGRFFDADDKTDRTQQAYYGIKEPIKKVDNKRYFTWEEVVLPAHPARDEGDGTRGLWRVDQIEVGLLENSFVGSGVLTCRDGGTSCLPDYLVNNPCPVPNPDDTENEPAPCLKALEQYISGIDYCDDDVCDCDGINCVDGWYKLFHDDRERNVGQATLLGGLVTFTTYQPFEDLCMAEGLANLYGVYYLTGTAWHENIFDTRGIDDSGNIVDRLELGRGLATTPNLHVGSGSGSGGPKAFVQTSTGEIIEIQQDNLPIKNYKTGPSRWKEYNR